MKSIEKFKFLNRNMNIDVFNVVFKTILTINAMKLMENEDVEPFSHFDVVSKRPISISPILNIKIWP